MDLEEAALAATGFEIVRVAPATSPLPATIPSTEPSTIHRAARGAIEVATARMGPWIHSRATFGSLSGYTSGWCDMPHWGMVLSGDLAIVWEDHVELLTAGDAYYCPPGPPGHRLEVADEATVMDYTPIDRIRGTARRAEWRRSGDLMNAAWDVSSGEQRDGLRSATSGAPEPQVATGTSAVGHP